MNPWIKSAIVSLAFAAGTVGNVGHAGDLGIHVILSGQVAPGVYGQVQLGNAPPPPLVYEQPVLVVAQSAPPPPVYLHVPPGHARNWRKYCRDYNACSRPVYFVRSEEYEPNYERHDHGHGHDRDNDRGRDRGNDEHDRGHGDDDRDRGRGHDHHDDN